MSLLWALDLDADLRTDAVTFPRIFPDCIVTNKTVLKLMDAKIIKRATVQRRLYKKIVGHSSAESFAITDEQEHYRKLGLIIYVAKIYTPSVLKCGCGLVLHTKWWANECSRFQLTRPPPEP